MRRDLVAELRDHLSELPPDTDLEARLGRPEAYAADLRAAAGLERRRGAVAFVRARRPRNVALGLAAVAVAGLAIAAVGFIQTYQPLAFRGTAPRDSRPSGLHVGRPFRLGIDVQNEGRFPVRVLGVPYSSGPFAGLPVSARVMMSSGPGGKTSAACGSTHVTPAICGGGFVTPSGPYVAFRPFDLKPGQARDLLLDGVYGKCGAAASNLGTLVLRDFPVRFGFLWRKVTVHIRLPKERVIIPPNIGCRAASERMPSFHRLIAGQEHVFDAGSIKAGARILCLRRGVRAGALVPRRGQSAVGIAEGRSGSATIRLTTRADGSVVARCGPR
jgi:hypothetical protein